MGTLKWLAQMLVHAFTHMPAWAQEPKVVVNTEVLELSVTLGYMGFDVKKEEIECLDKLLCLVCLWSSSYGAS